MSLLPDTNTVGTVNRIPEVSWPGSLSKVDSNQETAISFSVPLAEVLAHGHQAVVCKSIQAGAIPARDSISSGISVERYTLMAVRKDLPNRNKRRDNPMLDRFIFPS